MALPLHELAYADTANTIVRVTENGLEFFSERAARVELRTALIPDRQLEEGEQYRFHFDMTKCIGCRSCEIACNEQNATPPDLRWRRIGEIEGGTYPDTLRHYLSMGCNHCLSAECVKGCPVNAYTKDPVTGIVLHSADACIGCQYCVWNCPYSVPQFNPERGVVGKCDMCHGRLTKGLEPACVNSCPENAIEIEIVNQLAWRVDHTTADAPGMPPAGHTISTTRITLPEHAATLLGRVDVEMLRYEHPHWSLVWMTSFIQLAAGALTVATVFRYTGPVMLALLLGLTIVGLNIPVFHLGRPAYAWRALKMWRRSWLSREVLLFGLFFGTLALLTAAAGLSAMHLFKLSYSLLIALRVLAPTFGIAGVVASAYIYLVPARPAWNMLHTPADFLLSSMVLGSAAIPLLLRVAAFVGGEQWMSRMEPVHFNAFPTWPMTAACSLWLLNQIGRAIRLRQSSLYEHRASFSLLKSGLRGRFCLSFLLIGGALFFHLLGMPLFALPVALAGILCARYLFFVSVVPLNMALTFVRTMNG